jgi:hypothetical protein
MLITQQGLLQIVYLDAFIIVLVCYGIMTCLRCTALSRRDWWQLLAVCFLMLMLTVVGVMRIGNSGVDILWQQRYYYIQTLLLLLVLIITMNKIVRWRDWSKARQAGAVLLISLYLMVLNWAHWDYLKSDAREGRRLAEFLRKLDKEKHQQASSIPITWTFHRAPLWSIHIRIKSAQSNR